MWNVKSTCFALVLPLLSGTAVASDYVIEDGGVGLTFEELEFLVRQWTPQMREVAAKDHGDRLELLSLTLANKRVANEADKFAEGAKDDDYWNYQMRLQAEKRNYVLKKVAENLEIPDFNELAAERYQTEKDKYALIKETRISSHILLKDVAPDRAGRIETEKRAQAIYEELEAGADFGELVAKYSEDPVSRNKGGKFDRWMTLGDLSVTPRYSGALFEIEEIGGYAKPIGTEFGVHIIRLDDIREKSYKPYEQVKAQILVDLETEWRKLAMRDYLVNFRVGDDAFIDGDAMDRLFAPYQNEQAQ